MTRKILIFTILVASAFFALPADSYGSTDRSGNRTSVAQFNGGQDRLWQQRRHRNRGKRNWANSHGYRNYGQYRRTQVGNRRYRTVTRYYYTGGRRYTRRVRLFY